VLSGSPARLKAGLSGTNLGPASAAGVAAFSPVSSLLVTAEGSDGRLKESQHE
jgi:hypothetical protein